MKHDQMATMTLKDIIELESIDEGMLKKLGTIYGKKLDNNLYIGITYLMIL